MAKTEEVMIGFPGVYVAALVYSFSAWLVLLPLALFSGDFQNIAMAVVYPVAMCLLGILIVGPIGLLCFGAVISFDFAFGRVLSSRTASIAAGGLTGFVCTGGPLVWFEPFCLVLALTGTIVGQLFAARFFDRNATEEPCPGRQDWWRYDLRQMMKATAWVAVALACARLIPSGVYIVGIGSLVWVCLQAVTFYSAKTFKRLFLKSRSQ